MKSYTMHNISPVVFVVHGGWYCWCYCCYFCNQHYYFFLCHKILNSFNYPHTWYPVYLTSWTPCVCSHDRPWPERRGRPGSAFPRASGAGEWDQTCAPEPGGRSVQHWSALNRWFLRGWFPWQGTHPEVSANSHEHSECLPISLGLNFLHSRYL